jgi:hypothetical protein
MISHNKCLLHVIDLNQAPKFFSDQAFKRFKLGEKNDLDDDVEALKDLVLLDIQKRVRCFSYFYDHNDVEFLLSRISNQ